MRCGSRSSGYTGSQTLVSFRVIWNLALILHTAATGGTGRTVLAHGCMRVGVALRKAHDARLDAGDRAEAGV